MVVFKFAVSFARTILVSNEGGFEAIAEEMKVSNADLGDIDSLDAND